MPEIQLRKHAVANSLLQFFQVGKTSFDLTRPNKLIPYANLKDAILAWDQCNFANRLVKRSEQFLGYPGSQRHRLQ
jgi:hypothetical protein